MKPSFFTFLVSSAILLMLAGACKKQTNNPPRVTTVEVYGITKNSAECRWSADEFDEFPYDGGVCWSKNVNPTIADNYVSTGRLYYNVSCSMKGLELGVTYHVRAYSTNSAGISYGNELVFTTTPNDFAIGQAFGGGIVFYIDNSGKHGYVCAPRDQGKKIWGDPNIETGANGSDLGTGRANTDKIVQVLGAGDYAAYLCKYLNEGGYTDWFLPSIDEIKLMCSNLYERQWGDFGNGGNYWSSSETKATNAWVMSFTYKDWFNWNKSNHAYYVRAVRTF